MRDEKAEAEISDKEALDWDYAEAFKPLIDPRRYKGARGGRGSGKSHFVAERLVLDCIEEHHRVACMREFQSSISESAKRTIEDKIAKFKLSKLFKITDNEIRGPNDSLFIFKGLHGHTAESIKSLEGFTRLWVEEAQTISQNSLDLAIPTFRQHPGLAIPELYFTWNPGKPTDPIETMFAENSGDPDYACVTVNFRHNPWFPDDLKKDIARDKRRNKDKYTHIWLGGYKNASEARVFSNWRVEYFETPADARFYYGADWGFSIDPTVLVRCFIDHKKKILYVDYEAYKVGCKLKQTPALFDLVPNSRKWSIVADSARPETIDLMKDEGFKIEPAIKGPNSVIDGVEFLQDYDIIVHPRCVYVADELAFYSYKTDKKTNEVLPQLEDKKNHVIDALRYAVESVRHSKDISVSDGFVVALDQLTKRGGGGGRFHAPQRNIIRRGR